MKLRYFLLALLCVSALMGAGPRQMLRGYPLGSVMGVDKEAGTVSVDLGSMDGVMKGMGFAVVDAKGMEITSISAGEVYSDLFWSDAVTPQAANAVMPGMQVRWLFTPEVTALLSARKQGTVEAYRDFITRYPESPFLPELIKGIPEATLKELDPDYYQAWKSYTKEAFQEVIKKRPGTGFAIAADSEIKSIEAYEAKTEEAKKEREKAAAAAGAEQKGQGAAEQKARKPGTTGKLENKSESAVRFVFEPVGGIPETRVRAGSAADVMAASGSYTYKIYKVEEIQPSGPSGGLSSDPLKEGSVDVGLEPWNIVYP